MKAANLSIILAVVVLDAVSKAWAIKKNFASLILSPGFFDTSTVIVLLGIFILLYFLYWAGPPRPLGFSLILGGAAANIVDRLPDGRVIDFINLGITTLNLADLAIMIGIALLLMSNVKAQISK